MPEATISQAHRPLEIQTPLGPDVLGLRSVMVRERLGMPFTIEAELSSEDPDISFDDIVGHPVVVRINVDGATPRYWHALVARFQFVGTNGRFIHYRALLVPWIWLLSRSAGCKIFQEQNVPDIIKAVFRANEASDFEDRLSGSYEPWEYCAQYRETDLAFVTRLMEQEGITYYYTHDDQRGQLILADDKAAYEAVPGYETLPYRPPSAADSMEASIKRWTVEHEVQPTKYSITDYNPLTPTEQLLRMAEIPRSYGAADREVFDFPGELETPAEAEHYSRIRLDEIQAAWQTLRGETNCLAFSVGHTFTLSEHPRADQNREHLLTSVQLSMDAGEFVTAEEAASPRSSCHFTAIPSETTYRPARVTPRPVIQGPQPAVIVGPSGEEIYTDEHGRVKVQFFWDREGGANENSSCWVRVAQSWAGKKWGAFFLPRIGHEVLVEFLEGDPDRPVVTGSVYNAQNKPPYDLPAEKTKSTLKSNSSKDGAGFNEIRFEDKKDSEQVFIHAQKDMDVRVLNDSKEWVGHNRDLVVKNDQIEAVENDRHEKVTRDHIEEIGRDRHVTVKGKEAKEVLETFSLKIGKDVGIEIGENLHEKVSKDVLIEAKNIVLKATDNITLKIGEDEVYIAMTSSGIKLSAASGEIVLEAKDITHKATANFSAEATANASIKGTAGLKLESPATAEMKSSSTTVKGDGMLTLKGGVVMIN
jgi:type VI secretion system secreted protein VgrG